MTSNRYKRKRKTEKPVIAICYDFDKTLSPDDMQAQGYIQSVGYDIPEFWRESNNLAQENDMDQNLAYMYKMKEKAQGKVLFTRKNLREYGENVKLFPGVEGWFDRIREYGKKQGVTIEHYIISSGLKEMIEGTSVAQSGAFEKIYASSFYYDDNDVAKWPAQVVNFTNKTQFLFRIQKGVLDINDPGVNDYFPPEDIRIPFRNIIYIGDSDTDIPCMKLVNSYGGHSIGVYDVETRNKTKVYKMMNEGRIKYFAPADYSQGSELDSLVKKIIERTAVNEELESFYYANKSETIDETENQNSEKRDKISRIISLKESNNFATTHTIISELKDIKEWDNDEVNDLCNAALNNDQILLILDDDDIKAFFKKILKNVENKTNAMMEIAEKIDLDMKIYKRKRR